jgi:hypothetical protein
MIRSIEGRPNEMVKAGIGAIEDLQGGLFPSGDPTEEDSSVGNNKASRFDPELEIGVILIPYSFDLIK